MPQDKKQWLDETSRKLIENAQGYRALAASHTNQFTAGIAPAQMRELKAKLEKIQSQLGFYIETLEYDIANTKRPRGLKMQR